MMLQCATCSDVTVWTQISYVWRPWHSSHIWLWSWQTKGHKASPGTTSHSSAAATVRNSINQYVTDTLSSAGWMSGSCCWVLAAETITKCHSAISLTAHDWYQLQHHKLLSKACFQSVVC